MKKYFLLAAALLVSGCAPDPRIPPGAFGPEARDERRFVIEYRQSGPGNRNFTVIRDEKTGRRYLEVESFSQFISIVELPNTF